MFQTRVIPDKAEHQMPGKDLKLVLSLNGQETFGTVEMITFAFTFLTLSRGITVISSDGDRDDSPFFFFFFFCISPGQLPPSQSPENFLYSNSWLLAYAKIHNKKSVKILNKDRISNSAILIPIRIKG